MARASPCPRRGVAIGRARCFGVTCRPTLGVLPASREGEIKPLVPVRIMPAQGSVAFPSAPRAVSMPRSLHERQRQVLRARRARGPRGRRATAQFAQDPRRGLARRYPRADARDRAVGYARLDGRREEPADRRLRHVRPVHRSRGEDRHSPGPAGTACAVDRRARRHRSPRRAHLGVRSRAARRSGARRLALRARPEAPPRRRRQRHRRQRHADALRAPRPRDAGDGVHRDPREPQARGDAADAAGDRHAPASRARASAPRFPPSSRPSSSAPRWRAAARSSPATSTTPRPSR